MGHVAAPATPPARELACRCVYGMDVRPGDTGAIVLVRATLRRGGSPRMEMLYQGPAREGDSAWENARKQLTVDTTLGKALVVAGLPARSSLLRKVSAPFPSPAKARRVFHSLLDLDLPFSIEQCRYSFVDVRPDRSRGCVEALGLAARENDVQCALDGLEQRSGLAVDLLDQEALALWSAVAPAEASSALRVVCSLSAGEAILLHGQGGQLRAARVLSGVDPTDPPGFSRQIQRLWRAWELPASGPVTWTWSGADSVDEAIIHPLQQTLAETLNPDISFQHSEEPATLLARAYARRALGADPAAVNLLAAPHEPPRPRAARQKIQRSAQHRWVACALFLALLAGGTRGLQAWRSQQIEQEIDQAFLSLTGAPNRQRGMEPLLAKRQLESTQNRARTLRRLIEPGPLKPLQKLLREALRRGIVLDEIQVRPKLIRARGMAQKTEDLDQIKLNLEARGIRSQFSPDPDRSAESPGAFVLLLSLRSPPEVQP